MKLSILKKTTSGGFGRRLGQRIKRGNKAAVTFADDKGREATEDDAAAEKSEASTGYGISIKSTEKDESEGVVERQGEDTHDSAADAATVDDAEAAKSDSNIPASVKDAKAVDTYDADAAIKQLEKKEGDVKQQEEDASAPAAGADGANAAEEDPSPRAAVETVEEPPPVKLLDMCCLQLQVPGCLLCEDNSDLISGISEPNYDGGLNAMAQSAGEAAAEAAIKALKLATKNDIVAEDDNEDALSAEKSAVAGRDAQTVKSGRTAASAFTSCTVICPEHYPSSGLTCGDSTNGSHTTSDVVHEILTFQAGLGELFKHDPTVQGIRTALWGSGKATTATAQREEAAQVVPVKPANSVAISSAEELPAIDEGRDDDRNPSATLDAAPEREGVSVSA